MREMAMATTKRRNTGVVYVEDKHQRFVTFSKRRSGLFKKAADASVLTGASLAILLFSPSGRPFSFFSSSSSSSMSLDPLLDAFLSGSGAGAGSDVISADHRQQQPSPEVQRLTHEISQLERRIAIERAAKKIKKPEQKDAGWSRWSDASGIASLTTRGSSAAELRAVERQLEETQLKVLTQLDEIAAKEKTQDPKNYYETEEAENGVASAVTDQSPPSQDPPSSSSSNWTNNVNGNECWAELQFSDHDLGWGFNPTELPSFSSAVDDDEIAAYLFYHQDSTPPDIASIFA